jgi:uncharacterized membrane protein (UPF0182 family)
VSDPFEDYLRELARREREAAGDAAPDGAAPAPDGADDEVGAADDAADSSEPEADAPPAEEPTPIGRRRGGPPAGGPNDGSRSRRFRAGRAMLVAGVVLVLLVFFGFFGAILDIWTDAIWFTSIGYDAVYWTRIGTPILLFAAAFIVVLVILGLDLLLAGRLSPPPGTGGNRLRELLDRLGEAATAGQSAAGRAGAPRDRYGAPWGPFGQERGGRPTPPPVEVDFQLEDLVPVGRWVLVAIAILAALTLAGLVSGGWETILLFQHRVPYAPAGAPAVVDPVFGRDIGFFLFDLPFLRLIQSVLNGVLIAALLIALGRYLLAAVRGGLGFGTGPRLHLAILAGLWLLSVAFGYQLDKLELSYAANGVTTGVSYADANARFLAFDVLSIVAALTAAFLVASAFTRAMWPVVLAVTIWFGASVALGTVYPAIVQRFVVAPNEYATQEPYIANNISMTRTSYALDGWENIPFNGSATLSADALKRDAATFENARLWDYRPLGTTLDQLQTVRQYYDFYDVDVDRYILNGERRQVMLSGRELALDKNPQALTWVNERIVFTHGFGLAMVPVNGVDDQGLPQLIIKNLPPVSSDGAPVVTEPRIYFGERPNSWIITGAQQPEFDFPVGDQASGGETTTRWTGTTGIKLDSTLTKLLFALKFRDLNLFITDQATAQSQLLVNRTLGERVRAVAPFLRFDKDPYLVVTPEGRFTYIQDAYTVSDRFPDAEYFDGSSLGPDSGLAGHTINYIRNSVKITMDAYDGTLHFYVAAPSDPLIRAWQGIFPSLFEPLDAMPADILAHLRTAEEGFNTQARTFARYHVTNTQSFYNKDDLWTIPTNPQGATQQLPTEAYYVIMRMPSEENAEYLLLQPMVPAQRPNMISWIAARNAVETYGQVRVYQLPRDTSIFGPTQIEARIDQDPTISSQITLWNQSGSSVIRGNLLVVPVGNAIVYLEPIYLQSTSSAFPQFTKIVVATSTTVAWANTLEEALAKVLAQQPGASPSPGPSQTPSPTPSTGPTASPSVPSTPAPSTSPGATPTPGDVAALVAYADLHFRLAQDALRAGDFATYGDEMKIVEATLAELTRLTGGSPLPSLPTPSALPAPSASTAP